MSDSHFNPDDEVFKPIPGFPGYDVSNRGRVRSYWKAPGYGGGMVMASGPQRVLKAKIYRGYQLITLCSSDKHSMFQVHRLVLLTFVGPPPPGHECCHKDGCRSNNLLTNLYWGTKSRNALDRIKHGNGPRRKGTDSPMAKLTDQKVIQIRSLFAQGAYSKTELGEMFNIHRVHVGRIVRRKAWPHLP